MMGKIHKYFKEQPPANVWDFLWRVVKLREISWLVIVLFIVAPDIPLTIKNFLLGFLK